MSELILDDVVIRHISVSEMSNNVYLITERSSGKQLLVDAADDWPAIVELIASAAGDGPEPRITGIATTHQHWDHVRALKQAHEQYPVATYAGAEDVAEIESRSGVPTSHPIKHGDRLPLGEVVIECVHLRGHTPGSFAYVVRDSSGRIVILSGDSLFPGGVGNTWEDPQRFMSLFADVSERLFDKYPDESLVYPGHGDFTTLGTERPQLSAWQERGW